MRQLRSSGVGSAALVSFGLAVPDINFVAELLDAKLLDMLDFQLRTLQLWESCRRLASFDVVQLTTSLSERLVLGSLSHSFMLFVFICDVIPCDSDRCVIPVEAIF